MQSKAAIVKIDPSGSVVSTLLFDTTKPPGKIVKGSIDTFVIAIDRKVMLFNKDTMKSISSLKVDDLDSSFILYMSANEKNQIFVTKSQDKSYNVHLLKN